MPGVYRNGCFIAFAWVYTGKLGGHFHVTVNLGCFSESSPNYSSIVAATVCRNRSTEQLPRSTR